MPSEAPPATASTESPRRNPGMVFVFAIIFLDMMGIGLAIPVTPSLVASYVGGDLSRAAVHVGTMGALYTGMMFLCSPLLGALSDRFGRKPVLLGALGVSAASYFLSAFAPTLLLLLLARGLAGLGGASMTVAQTYIADISSHADRAKNFGLVGAAFGVGFIVGPALGGWLGNYGPTMPFLAAGVVTAINLAYVAWLVPESHHAENRRAFAWAEANPLGFIVTLRRHPAVFGFASVMLWVWFGQQCLHNNWVLYTSYRFNWTPADNGLSLAAVGVVSIVVQGWLIRPLLPRLGDRRAILLGLFFSMIAMVAYGLATAGWMMYAIIVGTCLAGIAGPALMGLISRQVGPSEQGAVQGTLTSLMSLTGIAGPLVANNLFAHFTSAAAPVKLPAVAFYLGAACFAIGMVGAWRLLSKPLAEPAAEQQAA